MGDLLFRRARHVVREIDRVHKADTAMRAGDITTLGELMNQSHTSLQEDFEVSCPELDSLVEIARRQDAVLGSRMVGAGFGGCTITLVEEGQAERVAAQIVEAYGKILGREPMHHLLQHADPVGEVQV